MPRKCSISALLNSSQSKKTVRKNLCSKVACNCNYCNGSLIDPRTKIIYESMQSKKTSDLDLNLLTLLSQSPLIKQDSALIEQDSALIEQDSAEDLSAFIDWPDLQKLASIEEDSDEFMFQSRK